MIAELGHAALWLAGALALLQFALAILFAKDRATLSDIRAVAIVQALVVAFAFAALLFVFAITDLSVALVALNSHGDKPFWYKLSASWGNHEGSMLLWVLLLSLFGGLLARFSKGLDARTMAGALATQAAVAVGFFAFLLFSSNPFARLEPAALQGRGLNPLLQDPGLVFHPPTLYVGYVGLSVAFAIAVGAMLSGRVDEALARAMRPWVLLSWTFLSAGILAGSYWAYYELGWGGYWFWDPVENASLMPWLAATALLHSVSVLAARGALKAWTMVLALTGFAASMLGTFLVRSGILTSVHAFAVDPERGAFILALMVLYVGAAFLLFALRIGKVSEGERFALWSREGALVGNNLLLSVILALVLIGTLYPVLAEAFGRNLSVGPPYFNLVTGPLALALLVLLAVGPLLRWRRNAKPLSKGLVVAGLLTVALLVAPLVLGARMSLLERSGLAIGGGLAVASLLPLVRRNPLRAPAATWGMVVAHFGIALLTLGIASESAFNTEKLAIVRPGDQVSVGPWLVELREVKPVVGPNWTAVEGDLVASRGSGASQLLPQQRIFNAPPTVTAESALLTTWDGQLYATIGQGSLDDGFQLRLWWKPLVTLIWLGGVLMALGGVISLGGKWARSLRDYRAKRAAREPTGYRAQRSW